MAQLHKLDYAIILSSAKAKLLIEHLDGYLEVNAESLERDEGEALQDLLKDVKRQIGTVE